MKYKQALSFLMVSSSLVSASLASEIRGDVTKSALSSRNLRERSNELNIIDLASFCSPQGYAIASANIGDRFTATSIQDFNGDGLFDLNQFASPQGRPDAGASYVIYGKSGGYNSTIDLANLPLSQGFAIYGAHTHDLTGYSVNGLKDVNGDGLSEIIISAQASSGINYVIYGKRWGYNSTLDLATFSPGPFGFDIRGALDTDAKYSSSAGDFNNDGFGDILIGSYASPLNRPYAGAAYIIYGKPGGYNSTINLGSLSVDQGFAIYGAEPYDNLGKAVSPVKDFNNDGIDDIAVGAPHVSHLGVTAPSSYFE